jgi:hypothetical protein
MAGKTSRDSDGNLVYVGNFDDTGANVNRTNPDNQNDNLGVSFSRSVTPSRLLRDGVFRMLNPTADHAADLYDLFREGSEPGIIHAFCFVGKSQMRSEHLERNVCFIE